MARGGVNLAVVQKARNSLLMRGVYPSIDSVRVEIGNTGSKTTIARYLKQLETPGPDATTRDRMSGALRGVVENLLDQVQEEGNQVFLEARAEFEHERKQLAARTETLENELAELQRCHEAQASALAIQAEELKTTHASLQAELTRNAGLSQQCADLKVRLGERDAQIQSLEEKLLHNRNALEHYRESVKEQRDQELRRHEAQLHQLQVEQRKLQETVSVKQDESTRLNRDNERLLGEARQHARKSADLTDTVQRMTSDAQVTQVALARAEGAQEALKEQLLDQKQDTEALRQALMASTTTVTALQQQIGAVEAENATLRQALEQAVDASESTDHSSETGG